MRAAPLAARRADRRTGGCRSPRADHACSRRSRAARSGLRQRPSGRRKSICGSWSWFAAWDGSVPRRRLSTTRSLPRHSTHFIACNPSPRRRAGLSARSLRRSQTRWRGGGRFCGGGWFDQATQGWRAPGRQAGSPRTSVRLAANARGRGLSLRNLRFDNGRVVAILDWEVAHVGEPRLDLGSLAFATLRTDRSVGGTPYVGDRGRAAG